MIDIIYGRDEQSGKLRLKTGSTRRMEGAEKSVPQSVSREHVLITIRDDSSIILKNLNIDNDTYVNGTAVEQKKIRKGDIIELGRDRYRLEWNVINPFIPTFIDISPLQFVWDAYQQEKISYQIKEKQFNVLKSLTSIITMSAFILGAVDIGMSGASLRVIIYIVAIGISIIFAVKSWIDASKMPQKYMDLDKRFKRKYLCPNPKCKHFMGFTDYELLSQNKKCSYCGATIIKHNNNT